MIEGYNLASRDIGSDSDPYLVMQLGDQVFNEREHYLLDNPNPAFHKHFDFVATFPGCPQLIVHAMDYDDLFGDDLIGTTIVDLEDRYFLPEWRAINEMPIEYRSIYHPSSNVSQGVLKMWIEINNANIPEDQAPKIYDITPKPPYEVEVRLVIWDTKDIKMMDAEGTSDVFVKAYFDNKKPLETDTHFRCQTGKASFNYRLKFNEALPRKDYNLTIQAYDRDFFKSNDIIGATRIDLK
jgi:Ca2+-dependent lipid-binding protein